ncbi:MAG TPA: DUF4389 domain-containing protein [Acidimicrobiales bacterium]|nr:DUF4389 domain-containing protein [Acidimicrobiales bacterium]
MPPYPLNLDVTSPASVARWRPLLNWLLLLPHFIWLAVLSLALEIVSVVSWFVIVITGKAPESLTTFMVAAFRYQWRVYAYLYAWTEDYPSFSPPMGYTDPGGNPAVLNFVPDQERNRITVLLRFFLAIPQLIVLYIVGIAGSIALLVAWFAVLITGRWPEGLRTFCIGYYRWYLRFEGYFFLVTDAYPPFRLGA